jgi:hypothetical protein
VIFRSTGNTAEAGDGLNSGNTTEGVRYIRRRKFGRKRRSYYVKYRVSNKTQSNTTNHEDEHSQEYISRRRDSAADGSAKEEEEEKSPPPSPVNSVSKQPKFKQLTLDQFLKRIPPKPSVSENTTNEETTSEVKNEDIRLPRRTKRLSNTHVSKSETDLDKMVNGTSEENFKKSTGKFFFIVVVAQRAVERTFLYNRKLPEESGYSRLCFLSKYSQQL